MRQFASMGKAELMQMAMEPREDGILLSHKKMQPFIKNQSHPYPRYLLSTGMIVDFMCMSHDNMELYHTVNKSKLLYDRENLTWWMGDDQEYPKRTTPLLGVVIQKEIL